MRILALLFLLSTGAEAKATKAPKKAEREYFNNKDFHDPSANLPVTVDSASDTIDVTIYWNAQKDPNRSVSSEEKP